MIPFKILDCLDCRQDLTLGIFFNICMSKKRIFVNVYLDIISYKNLMIAIILVKTWWKSVEWYRRYSEFLFPGDTLSTWKIETKLSGNLHLCQTVFVQLKYLDHNLQTILEFVEQFLRKLCVFQSTWKNWKRKQIFWGIKKNLYCPCILFVRPVGVMLKKRKLCIARWNRMAGICFAN